MSCPWINVECRGKGKTRKKGLSASGRSEWCSGTGEWEGRVPRPQRLGRKRSLPRTNTWNYGCREWRGSRDPGARRGPGTPTNGITNKDNMAYCETVRNSNCHWGSNTTNVKVRVRKIYFLPEVGWPYGVVSIFFIYGSSYFFLRESLLPVKSKSQSQDLQSECQYLRPLSQYLQAWACVGPACSPDWMSWTGCGRGLQRAVWMWVYE